MIEDKILNINWFVLFVMGGREKSICEFLENEGLHTFFPQAEVVHKQKGKRILVLKPLFPSYIFVISEISAVKFQEKIRMIRQKKDGILKELRYENVDSSTVSYKEKIRLLQLLDSSYVLRHSTGVIEDDKIAIIDGPLQGYEGRIVKIDRHKRQATLMINIFGKEVDVKVSLEVIKKMGSLK